MTSSADVRRNRTEGRSATSPRRRVAGSRRSTTPAGAAHPPPPRLVDRRARQRPQPADQPADQPAGAAPEKPARRHTAISLWRPLLPLVLAAGLLALTLGYSLRPALTDADRSAAVGSARTTLESVLSYSGTTFDEHVAEVAPLLAAPFKDEFTQVARTDIKPLAVKNEATVQARVQEAGIMATTGDGGPGTVVRVMAFVNQATTSTAQRTPAIDQNRVIATMTKVGDRWLLSALEAY